MPGLNDTNSTILDNPTDSTEEIQRYIDAARHSGGAAHLIYLPSGTFYISSTLLVQSAQSLIICGQGQQSTILVWIGDNSSPLFSFDRCQACGLRDIGIEATSSFPLYEGVRIIQGVGGTGDNYANNQASRRNIFKDVRINSDDESLQYGFAVRLYDVDDDTTNDLHRFLNCNVRGYTQSAYLIEGRNAKDILFLGCTAQSLGSGQRGVDTRTIPGQGGAFSWIKGIMRENQIADFDIGDRNDAIEIRGGYSERSKRLLLVLDYAPPLIEGDVGNGEAGEQNEMYPVAISGYRFGAPNGTIPTDGEIIQFYASGPLSIDACRFGNYQGTNDLYAIRYEPKERGGFGFTNSVISTAVQRGYFPARIPDNAAGSIAHTNQAGTPVYVPILPHVDFLSNKYTPTTVDDWLLRGIPAPLAWWPGQEPSGNLFDANKRSDGIDIVPNGSPLYQQIVSGWAKYWVGLSEVADQRFGLSENQLTSPLLYSQAAMARFIVSSLGAANRYLCVLGSGNAGAGGGPLLRFNATGRLLLIVNGVTATGVYDYRDAAQHIFVLVYNRTAGTVYCVTDQETINGTYSASVANTADKGFGASANTLTSFGGLLSCMAWWHGPAAEQIGSGTIISMFP